MSKIVLDEIASGYQLSKVNENFQKIEDELNNKVLYRNAPEGEPNTLENSIDANGFGIFNLGGLSLEGYEDLAALSEQVEAWRDEVQVDRDEVVALHDDFDSKYLGTKASEPTVDNQGNPLTAGQWYFNTSLVPARNRVYNGVSWQDIAPYEGGVVEEIDPSLYASQAEAEAGVENTKVVTSLRVKQAIDAQALRKANNLSDLANASTARTNLGLGDAATKTAGTLTGNVLLLAEDNKLPALDGSLLTNLPEPVVPKELRQVVFYETGAYASGSAVIPQDDTIPQQSTDGTQFMSQAFTPTAADSIIEVEVLANLDNQSGTYAMTGALFKDTTEDAVAVGRTNSYFTSGCQLFLKYREVAGSTAERTYKFKAGTPSAVVTAFNGYTGRLMGGQMNSYIKITEYAP